MTSISFGALIPRFLVAARTRRLSRSLPVPLGTLVLASHSIEVGPLFGRVALIWTWKKESP